ncbi:hypothetical protein SAMN05444422_10254 [Halobiforma haloterrestris]|uniref:Uncharacterized protein n=1 Tax=Natronobacterium haloterrestre TaxID=148448 RepID=A0A1I1E410_NATHA|nr:hypothetical protein [Halobiforma haloterrestris]SFB79593.1 hypothetical protein SAMN05444422_10254 [Halobiforma haloterrestris]
MIGRLRGRQTHFYIDVVYGGVFALGFVYLLVYGMDARVATFQGGLILGYFLRVWENMSVYEQILEEEVAAEAEEQVEAELGEQVPDEVEAEVDEQIPDEVAAELDEQLADEVAAELDERLAEEVESELEDRLAEEVATEIAAQLGYIDEDLADDVRERLEHARS